LRLLFLQVPRQNVLPCWAFLKIHGMADVPNALGGFRLSAPNMPERLPDSQRRLPNNMAEVVLGRNFQAEVVSTAILGD
jgi:hypothetical protein